MSLDAGEELDAHFLSSLGRSFEARLANQTGNVEAALAAYRSRLDQMQQELDLERAQQADQKQANTEANVRLALAQARESFVQDIARIEERTLLTSRLSEQASFTATSVKIEAAVELRHVREAVAEARAEAGNIGAEHAKLAERIATIGQQASAALDAAERASAQIIEVRTDMAEEISTRISDEFHRTRTTAQTTATETAHFEPSQIEAQIMATLLLKNENIAQLDERVTNMLHTLGQASGMATELRTKLAGERDRIRDDAVAFKAQLLADSIEAHKDSEQRVLAAVSDAHASTAALVRIFLEERAAIVAAPSEEENHAMLAACLDWLVNHGETVLTDTSGTVGLDTALSCSDEVFVDAAYRWLLNRPAEPAGLEHHVGRMRNGMSRPKLLVALARSAEASARLRHSLFLESDDRAFLYGAYTLLLGRGLDGAGESHYLNILTGKGERGRHNVLRDIALSQEARLNRTAQASAWRFITRAGSRAVRLRETWLHMRPGSRAAQHYAWQTARMAVLEAETRRASTRAHKRMDGMRKELVDLIGAMHGAEHAHIVETLANSLSVPTSGVAAMSPFSALKPPRTPDQKSKPSFKVLLSDTSSERQIVGIAQAIRAELQKLGIN